jgi:hypothetical protein
LRGREPKQHTALAKKTKTTATPPEQEQQECRSCSSVGDAQLSSRFSSERIKKKGKEAVRRGTFFFRVCALAVAQIELLYVH